MSGGSKIEWTEDTWNPTTGCTKVSDGCKNCYAKREWARLSANPKTVYFGRKFEDVRCHPERLDYPLHLTKPRLIFVDSMSDLFHEDVPNQFIADVFAVMACTTRHRYQILTKRAQRMLEWFRWLDAENHPFGFPSAVDPLKVWPQWTPLRGNRGGYDNCGPLWPLENVWLGVSVEDQPTAEERIALLLQTPAAVRWISAEPLLQPIDITAIHDENEDGIALLFPLTGEFACDGMNEPRSIKGGGIGWVVAGGESGPKARPSHPDSFRSLRDQCHAANVPFLFKQWGEWGPPIAEGDVPLGALEGRLYKVGKRAAGRLLDGIEHNEYPASPLNTTKEPQ